MRNPEFRFVRQWEQLWQQKELTQVFMADKNGIIYDFDGKIVALANAPGFVPPPNPPVVTAIPAVQIAPALQHPQNIQTALMYPNSITAWMNPQPPVVNPNPPAVDIEDAEAAIRPRDTSSASAPHDAKKIYGCKCGEPDTEEEMVKCDGDIHGSDGGWFHYKCVGVTHEQAVEKHWFCDECRPGRIGNKGNDSPSENAKQSGEASGDNRNDGDFGDYSGSTRKKLNNSRKRKPQDSSSSQPKKRRRPTPKSSDHNNEELSTPTTRQARKNWSISPGNARNLDDFASRSLPKKGKQSLSESSDPRLRKRIRSISNNDALYRAASPSRNYDDVRAGLIKSSRPDDLLKISYDDVDVRSSLRQPDSPGSSDVKSSMHPSTQGKAKIKASLGTLPKLSERSASTETKVKPTPWSELEKVQVMQLMQDVIEEGKVNLTERRWTVISQRLWTEFGVERTEVAVKNYWNREGRQAFGIDERGKARSTLLVTGVQSAESRKATRIKKKAQREATQDEDN